MKATYGSAQADGRCPAVQLRPSAQPEPSVLYSYSATRISEYRHHAEIVLNGIWAKKRLRRERQLAASAGEFECQAIMTTCAHIRDRGAPCHQSALDCGPSPATNL